jgi:hypothetical protein
MSVPFFLCLLACIGAAVYARYLSNRDRADRDWADIREWHLLHRPTAGCLECAGK